MVCDDIHSPGRRDLETWLRTISRSPMSCEAKRAVPPPSEAEQRRISVLPQFSTMVAASSFP
jgi:hypothetical protein